MPDFQTLRPSEMPPTCFSLSPKSTIGISGGKTSITEARSVIFPRISIILFLFDVDGPLVVPSSSLSLPSSSSNIYFFY